MLSGGVTNLGQPSTLSSLLMPGQLDTFSKAFNTNPLASPHESIGPVHPEMLYNPVQRIQNALGGAATGILKGIIPDEKIQAPNHFDPLTVQAENLTRTPTAIIANIIGGITTAGAYNAIHGAVQQNTQNEKARGDAIRAGKFAIARQIHDAQITATGLGALQGFALAKLPGAIGKSVAAKVATGAALGYPQDVASQAIERYSQKGKVDANEIGYAPGLGTLLGAAIPAGAHYAPQLAHSLANGTLGTKLKAGIAKGAARATARRAQKGFMQIGGGPLDKSYTQGEAPTQYAGTSTGDTHQVVSSSAMQQDANQAVSQALESGNNQIVHGWISHYESQGDALRANAVRQAALDPENFNKLSPTEQAQVLQAHMSHASNTGRELQSLQNNPLYKFREEFIDEALKDIKGEVSKGINKAAEEVREIVEGAYNELLENFTEAFRETVNSNGATRASGSPSRVKRSGGTRNGKIGNKRGFRLTLKTIKEAGGEARSAKLQRVKLTNVLKKQFNSDRRKALAAISKLEKSVFKQTKLTLNVKRDVRALSAEALATLSPEERAYFYDLNARKNRASLFAKLDARLKAAEQVREKGTPKTIDELYKEVEPIMTVQEKAEYTQRKTAIGRRKYLASINKVSKPAVRRTVLDRLLEAQGHDLLHADTPEVLDKIMGQAKLATVMSSDDWKRLNAYILAATDPTLTPRDARRAQALLDRFMYDHKAHNMFRKWVTWRTEGLLLQGMTQARNWLDMGSYWLHYRGPHAALRELGEFAYSKVYRNEYEGPGERGLIIGISKDVKEFYKKNEISSKDELQNILFDVEHGTNTARNYSGDAFKASGLDASPIHTVKEGKIGDTLRKVDKKLGGTVRAVVGGGDRLAYANVYEASLSKEIEIYKRITGNLPDPKSEVYKKLRLVAKREAEQATLTNEGVVSNALGGFRDTISKQVDKVANREGKDSLNAGALVLPFTKIVGNLYLRPMEMVPVAGTLGIHFNRAMQADLKGVAAYNRQTFGHIFASQMLGLFMTGAAGGIGTNMFYAAGYHGALNIGPKDKNPAVDQTKEDAGFRNGSVNVTAFARYFQSGGKAEAFEAQEGDSTFYLLGINTPLMPLMYMTAPGREDAHAGKPYAPRNSVLDIPRNVWSGVSSMYTQNDALSGFVRPITQATETRDPDTGEISPTAGAVAVGTNLVSFKIPGSDLVPQPAKEPRTLVEQVESRIPFVDHLVPDRLDTEGNVKMKPGLLGRIAANNTYASFMNELRAQTGKANHLLGALPRKIDVTNDEGNVESTPLTKRERSEGERVIKAVYVSLVAQVSKEERFQALSPEEQVHVLSRVKNDATRSYLMALEESKTGRKFKPRITFSTSGGPNYHKKDAPGAKALYNGNAEQYHHIVMGYIKNARLDERNHVKADRLNQNRANR